MNDAARKLITDRFFAVWNAGALAAMKIEIDGQKFVQPKNQTWGRLSMVFGENQPNEVGPNSGERTPFVFYLQVFIPDDTGTRDAYLAADILKPMRREVLRHSDASGATVVHIRPVSCRKTTPTAGFAAFNVTATGYFDYEPAQA